MQEAPIPQNEERRIAALHALKILDTPAEERFDRITRIATHLFRVPISTITLVDASREWYKASCGVAGREGPRPISFCGHVVAAEEDLFVVPDASRDERFADNPMVIGFPFIRFYAGKALAAPDGSKVGVFCIKDTKPRTMSQEDIAALTGFAEWAEIELNARELQWALNEREAMAKEKDEFLFQTIHDLRSPSTGIKLVLEKYDSPDIAGKYPEITEDMSLVRDANARMLRLLKDLLEIAKGAQPGIAMRKVPVELGEILQSVIREITPAAESKKVTIIYAAGEWPIVWGDPERLKEVFSNLLDNAIKYNKEGGSVTMSYEARNGRTRVAIRDTGAGIITEDRAKLFTPYFRGVAGSGIPGTGLGLYIVKKLVEKMGGGIVCDSTPGEGTTMTVALDAAPQNPAA